MIFQRALKAQAAEAATDTTTQSPTRRTNPFESASNRGVQSLLLVSDRRTASTLEREQVPGRDNQHAYEGRSGGCDHGPEQDVAHEVHSGQDADREQSGAGQKHVVPNPDDVLLATLLPTQAVIHRGGEEQDCSRDGCHQADKKRDPVAPAHSAETRRERHGQQEREQDLRARKNNAQLVQELDQLTIGSILVGFSHVGIVTVRNAGCEPLERVRM